MPGVCPRCLGEVYFAEEKLALGKVWHTFCFSCRNCRKLLDSWTVATHSGELFCRNCYSKNFSTKSVKPTSFPLESSPIISCADRADLVDSSCETVSDCCRCCCHCNASGSEQVLTSDWQLDEQRLRGGGSGCCDQNLDKPLRLGSDECGPEEDTSQVDLPTSQMFIPDQTSGLNSAPNVRPHTTSRSVKSPVMIDPLREKSSYPPLPPQYMRPRSRKSVSFQSGSSSGPAECSTSAAQENPIDNECTGPDIINFEQAPFHNSCISNEMTASDAEENDESDDECSKCFRMRGGCGGGGGGCCGGGSKPPFGLQQSSCGRRYEKERSSTIEGACGCSGRAKSGCGMRVEAGCSGSSGCGTPPRCSPKVGGCCGKSCDDDGEGPCASKGCGAPGTTGYETCPPRSPDPCSSDPSNYSSCSADACSPPCSGRKGCCPPAGCRPVRRRIARCNNTPCTGDAQSCGGGGCCGSGCRGGCGKPGQTCMPLKPCATPPCLPHPRSGGSPCLPPRGPAPQPPCCRSPGVLGTSGCMSGSGGCGGGGGGTGGCCSPYRSGSPAGRSAGGGGCAPPISCQPQEIGRFPLDTYCQFKVPTGCECLGGGLDCQRCGRKVYRAEMQIASGVPYHNICFSCFCCRKPLETLTYHENCGEIYCKQCYVRNFGPQGYGYSGVLQTPM